MTRAIGRSLELYYIDGRPDGMLTAELFNWTGHVLMTPRTQIASALSRVEAGYAGIYLLLGERDGEPLAYIGEGEDISTRIRSHDVQKEWWNSAVLVTAAANKLNKAHVRYLEARMIATAREIGRTPLENGTSPSLPSLSDADIAKMEAFLENLLVVLPAVRVDMFIQRTRPAPRMPSVVPTLPTLASPSTSGVEISAETGVVRFRLQLPRKNFSANAELNERGEFVVLAGSQARPPQKLGSYKRLHDELTRTGVIAPDQGGQLHFTASYAFDSPSAAASVATGTSNNGTDSWKHVGTGISYKDWEAEKIGAQGGLAEKLLTDLCL